MLINKDTKKIIYLSLFDFFGAELGALISLTSWCVSSSVRDVWELNGTWYAVIGALIAVGTAFGLWAGPVAWKKIYVEGVRGKKYITKH